MDKKQQAKDFIASRGGAVRAIVLRDAGIHSEILRRMVAEGTLFVPMRGVYALRDLEFAQESSLAFVAARNPDLVLCLKSAAILHGLTTENPTDWFMIAGLNVRPPETPEATPKVALIRWRKMVETAAEGIGVERMSILGVPVAVTTPERTVCDLIRFRQRGPAASERLAVEALATFDAKYPERRDDLTEMAELLGCRPQLDLLLVAIRQAAEHPSTQAEDEYTPGGWANR